MLKKAAGRSLLCRVYSPVGLFVHLAEYRFVRDEFGFFPGVGSPAARISGQMVLPALGRTAPKSLFRRVCGRKKSFSSDETVTISDTGKGGEAGISGRAGYASRASPGGGGGKKTLRGLYKGQPAIFLYRQHLWI